MPRFIAHSDHGRISMRQDYRQKFDEWTKTHHGGKLEIETGESETAEMRRFFEGAVVPYYFYQHAIGVFKYFSDARENLKLEFCPVYIRNDKGELVTIPGTTKGHPKSWWMNEKETGFLDRIARHFDQNGHEFPDSEDYKKWLDMGPMVGEIYPPLKRLIENYKNN